MTVVRIDVEALLHLWTISPARASNVFHSGGFLEGVWWGINGVDLFYHHQIEPLKTSAVMHCHGIPTEM